MPSPEDKSATTVVIEMEPGRIYVKIAEPKPEPGRIEMLLRLTIEQWFNAHPQFVIDKAEAVTDHGVMQGIHVWYHVNDRGPEATSAERPQQAFSLAVELHTQVFQQLPMEHIEAVVDEAIHIWRSHQDDLCTTIVINPRGIAVVLDKQANRGAVVPVALIYPAIDDAAKTGILAWLEAPSTRFRVIQIAGSWFAFNEAEKQRNKVVDPPFLRSNMTYDTEPPPTE